MHRHIVLTVSLFIIALLFGCSSPKQTQTEVPPPTPEVKKKKTTEPEISIRVGSLNLFTVAKKIESADISDLADIVKHEMLDIVSVQGVTRYPELKNRTDFVEEFSRHADMRNSFGEMITVSGRQTGNAIFSAYPIRSSENTPYKNLHSNNFEAALQGMIDCGARDVVVVSTRLPDRESPEDQATVSNLLSSLSILYINHPMIITGNLPRSEMLQTMTMYKEAQQTGSADAPRVWYSSDKSIVPMSTKIKKTPLGTLIIVEFGIFRQGQP